jgi:DNA polymerase III subunit gamma/tau
MEKHIALYRKYRPQKYSDIFSQDIVSEILKNSIKNNRLSHAYIFFGTRGVGKTTIARIFAKSINCEDNKNGEPCDVCYSCSIFNTNNNVDVIELDAASNNGVEEIRKLINNSKHAPTNMKNKVFIIDEAHMLTSNA